MIFYTLSVVFIDKSAGISLNRREMILSRCSFGAAKKKLRSQRSFKPKVLKSLFEGLDLSGILGV